MKTPTLALALSAAMAFSATPVLAQGNPLEPGWTLDEDASTLTFQSIKNGSKVESSTFSSYQGTISPDGTASIRVQLDSVDTGIDLRNVRMRFLFFETFQFPEAEITTLLDPSALRDLAAKRRVKMTLPFTMSLHGIEVPMEAETAVTLISDDLVSVATVQPIQVSIASFGLEEGIRKLEEAAKVTIVPSSSVTFDFLFNRNAGSASETVAVVDPSKTANETEGELSRAECVGRLEILSQTGNIYFKSGSAALDDGSAPLLATLIDIAQRCPRISFVIEGHTDAQGPADANQRLSEARAASVRDYLIGKGVDDARLASKGFGELRPVDTNDTRQGRARNRRIEFTPAPE